MKSTFHNTARRVLAGLTASFLAIVPAPAAILGPYVIDPNTLHLWNLDETDPGPATSVGNGSLFNLTPGGSAVLGATAFTGFGTAADTAASADSGLQGSNIVASALTGANGAFTFEAMIRTSEATAIQMIIGMDSNNPNSGRPFQFRIDGGQLRFINIGGSTVEQILTTIPTTGPDAFVANEWFHVAVTYNGSENTADNIKLYWTRVDDSRTAATEILSTTMIEDLAGNATFGAGNEYRGLAGSNLFGQIDEVRISDIARAADEMLFGVGGADVTPPAILSTVPADDESNVLTSINLVATFDELIQPGSGNITLHLASDDSVVETFDVTSSTQLTFDPLSITIDPTSTLLPGTEYYVLIAATAIEDAAANPFPGITTIGAWSFTADGTAPSIAALGPPDDAADALLTSCLSLSLDEDVQVGTGNITVHLVSDNSVVQTIDVTSGAVSLAGSEVSITLADLSESTGYYVNVPSGAFVDLSGNNFAGISGTTTWSFTTAAVVAPIVPYSVDGNTLHLWHFNEADPGPAAPAFGISGSFDLVPANGATLGASGFTDLGNAADLTTDVDPSMTGPAITGADVTGLDGQFTFEAIVNLSSIGVEQQIISMSNTGSTQVFQLRIEPTGEVRFVKVNGVGGTDNDQVAAIPTTGPDAFVPGKWFHVAVTYDGNDDIADNLKIYWTRVDPSRSEATEIGSFTLVGDLDTALSVPLRVGNRITGGPLQGLVDEVRISDVARASSEMFIGTGIPDIIPPSVVATDPVDDAINIPTTTNLTANFDEEILPGAGTITLKRSSDDSTVESFDVSTSSQLSFGLYTVTIDPSANLMGGVEYYVVADAGVVEDYFSNGNAAITDTTLWSFTTDGTAPMSTAMGPMADATGVSARSALTLSFDEAVIAGTGNITVHLASDDSIVQTIDVTSGDVTIVGTEVSIDLSQLAGLTAYYVNIDTGAFTDASGNGVAGINDSTTWAFTTAEIPEGLLFDEDFVGTTSDLDTSLPDTTIDGAAWVASPNFNEDGSIDQGLGSATLSFIPYHGLVYTVEASITGISGDANWFGLGFANGQSSGSSQSDRFIDGNVVGTAWMLMKGDASGSSNSAFLGTGVFGSADNGLVSGEPWTAFTAENPGGDIDLRIVLDTSGGPGTWTATWYAKRPVDPDYTEVRPATAMLTESFSSVGLALANAGVFGTIESFRLYTGDAPTEDPLVLKISQSGGNLDFEWNSLSGMQYTLLSSTDLSTSPSTWLPYNDGVSTYEDIPSTGTGVQTLNGVAKTGDVRFFVLNEEEIPPFFSQNFDGGDGGFTIADPNLGTGTEWSWGSPNSPDQGGGAVLVDNSGSGSCWGTNLTGGYTAGTDASLRSGVIDLTGVAAANLSFALSLDSSVGHTYEVRVLDDTTDTVLDTVIAPTEDLGADSAWTTIGATPIPALALGQMVRLEWRFVGEGVGLYNGAYIDDVLITIP